MKSGNIALFVVCAVAYILGLILFFEGSAYQKNAKTTQGVVANSDMTYYDVVYTSDDGVERSMKRRHPRKGGRYHNGDELKVFYKIGNPDESRVYDGKKTGMKIGLWTTVLLLINFYSLYQGKKRDKTEKSFKATGRKVEAQIQGMGIDTETKILDRNPYKIDCIWVDPMSGRTYSHTIRYIWVDPETALSGRKTIDVYIDRNDPDKYYMDIEFLGPAAK